jgi:antitoxin CptB
MNKDSELKKMVWHSRRGMLELDLILVPFAEQVLPTLTDFQHGAYATLLSEEDQDLFQWLVKKQPAPSPGLQQAVDMVLSGTGVKS